VPLPMTDLESGPHLIHGSLAYRSLRHKRHLDPFSRFYTAHGKVSLYFTTGSPLFPLKIALHREGSARPSDTWFVDPLELASETASR